MSFSPIFTQNMLAISNKTGSHMCYQYSLSKLEFNHFVNFVFQFGNSTKNKEYKLEYMDGLIKTLNNIFNEATIKSVLSIKPSVVKFRDFMKSKFTVRNEIGIHSLFAWCWDLISNKIDDFKTFIGEMYEEHITSSSQTSQPVIDSGNNIKNVIHVVDMLKHTHWCSCRETIVLGVNLDNSHIMIIHHLCAETIQAMTKDICALYLKMVASETDVTNIHTLISGLDPSYVCPEEMEDSSSDGDWCQCGQCENESDDEEIVLKQGDIVNS